MSIKKEEVMGMIKASGSNGVTSFDISEKTGLTISRCNAILKGFHDDLYSGIYRESEPNELSGKGIQYRYFYREDIIAPLTENKDQADDVDDNISFWDAVKEQVDSQMEKYKDQICKILGIEDHISWLGLYSYLKDLVEDNRRMSEIIDKHPREADPLEDLRLRLAIQRAEMVSKFNQDLIDIMKAPSVIYQ